MSKFKTIIHNSANLLAETKQRRERVTRQTRRLSKAALDSITVQKEKNLAWPIYQANASTFREKIIQRSYSAHKNNLYITDIIS
jgi:hypothetical protein